MIKKIKTPAYAFMLTTLLALQPQRAFAAECTRADGTKYQTSILPCMESAVDLLKLGVNILSAGIAIVALGAVVYAGILYTTSAGDSKQTQKAIEMIRNVAIGFIAYALMYLLLNYIVPGGVGF